MDGAKFNRRELVRRSAQAGATIGVASSLSLFRPASAKASSLTVKGYNDDFFSYSQHSSVVPTLKTRLQDSNSTTIRTGFQWTEFQPLASDLSKPFSQWNNLTRLANLKSLASTSGVKILPVIATLPDYARSATGGCKPEHLDHWGKFVAEIARDLSAAGLLEAIEIGNEPNTFVVPPASERYAGESFEHFWARKNPWCMKYTEFADLITYAHVWIERYRTDGLISGPVKLVSGGLFAKVQGTPTEFSNGIPPYPVTSVNPIDWKEYLDLFQDHTCADYVIGFHPYDLGPYNMNAGSSETPNGNAISQNVCELFDQAAVLTGRDIWVTETGANSREYLAPPVEVTTQVPITEATQSSELYAIAWGLASRTRCKAMLVHRLYDSSVAGSEPPSSWYYRSGVYLDTESPAANMPNKTFIAKPAFQNLADAWSLL